jgi:hypothetical protein
MFLAEAGRAVSAVWLFRRFPVVPPFSNRNDFAKNLAAIGPGPCFLSASCIFAAAAWSNRDILSMDWFDGLVSIIPVILVGVVQIAFGLAASSARKEFGDE